MIHSMRRITAAFVALLTVLTLCIAAVPAEAADVITSTVNIAVANKNQKGPGYEWQNRYDKLILNGIHIDTEDNFGLRLPKNCTVELNGDNYIKASKYGISFSGTVVFKGSGSLTIEAGEIGLYLISQDNTQKIRLTGGTYKITAGEYGIYSDAADFSFVNGSMNINMTSDDTLAISGRSVNLLGGKFTSNAPVVTSHSLVIEGIDISVNANSTAFTSKNLSMRYLTEEYNGESSFTAKADVPSHRKSIIFGDNVPGFVDYILLAALALTVAALIFFPSLRRKKKTKELYERLEREGYR